MALITAGASATVTIARGGVLKISGTGIAVFGPGPRMNQQVGLRGGDTVEASDQDQVVYLTATTDLAYIYDANIGDQDLAKFAFDASGGAIGLIGPGGLTRALPGGTTASGLRKASATPLLLYVNQANFTVSGTGAAKADSYAPLLSPQGVTLTGTTAAGSANLDRNGLVLDISTSDDFQIAFYTQTPTLVNGITLFLCSDVSGFTNYYQVQLLSAPLLGQRDLGWNILGWKKSEATTTGAPDPTSIKQIRTQMYSAAGGAVATFDSIWANAKTRAKAMLMFDDGWVEAYDFNNGHGAFTYMQSKGLKGSMGIIGGLIGVTGYLTHANLRTINDAGWDLTTHGINYAGTVLNYQNLTQFPVEADAITNIKQNRDFLISNGYPRGANVYICPQGKYTETMLPSMRNLGITISRGTYEALAFPYFTPSDYMMKLPAVDHGGKTFAQIKPFIDRAILTGGTIIIYGHRLQTAAGATGLFMTSSEFEQTVDYLAANTALIDTVTATDWQSQVAAARIVF